jgi:glutamate-5-semialdehyde dehydrogenase
MNFKTMIEEKGRRARAAAALLATVSTGIKNEALLKMAASLERDEKTLIGENGKDLQEGERRGLSKALMDRLTLNAKRIGEMAQGLREVAALPDPVGEVVGMRRRPNGMQVGRVRVPIGVIGIIYESRPNVTADSAALCLKAGNAVFLRGGSEAIHSNRAIVGVLSAAGEKAGLPADAITFVDTTDRQAVHEMLKLDESIDLIIPRGGEELIKTVSEHARMPVIKHDKGLCHTYVDEDADLAKAERIAFNAKVQRPATCNATETLLVHQKTAPVFLPGMIRRFLDAGVELRGCPKTRTFGEGIREAVEEDWKTEHLDLILNVRVVADMDEAIVHMRTYGSRHSEAIVTENHSRAMRFLQEVDAAAVFVNASTRLHDGYQFGLGAEIGISTTRIHARGPMGLEELTSLKFIVLGDGQIRE